MRRVLKLIGLGAALVFALTVSLWTDVVWAQEQIAVYRVLPLQVTHDSVLKLAGEAFGMGSPTVTEDGEAFVLEQGQKILQIRKADRAILFSDNAKLWNRLYRPTLPPIGRAEVAALDFLDKHDIVPRDRLLILPGMIDVETQYVDDEGALLPNHHLVVIPVVLAAHTLEWVRVLGAKVEVRVGHEEEIIGVEVRWKDWQALRLIPRFSPQQARELLREKLGLSQLPGPEIFDPPELVYIQGAPDGNPLYIYPVYMSVLSIPAEPAHFIPATEFSPLAIIEEPKAGAVFQEGQPISFRARVRFGSSPYRYQWFALRQGELSDAQVFRTSLPSGHHAITLVVTDRNGLRNSHTITIEVQPRPTAAATWPSRLILAGLLGGLGLLIVRPRRWLLLGVLGIPILVGWSSPSSSSHDYAAGGQQPSRYGPPTKQWSVEELSVSKNDGVVVKNLKWKNIPVASQISVPWLKVTVQDPQGQAFDYTLQLKDTDKPKTTDEVIQQKDCPGRGQQTSVGHRNRTEYTVRHTDAARNIQFTLTITQSLIVYWPEPRCPRFTAAEIVDVPELYMEVHVKKALVNPQPVGLKLTKIRVPIRIDFDPGGPGGPTGNWVLLVKADYEQGLQVLNWPTFKAPVPFKKLLLHRPLPCPLNNQGYNVANQIICTNKEIHLQGFDHYFQGLGEASVPLCIPAKRVGFCAQVHLQHPKNVSWGFVALDKRIVNENDEDNIEDEQEPARYVTGDPLNNVVFWYVAEWVPREAEYRFFSDQGVRITVFMEPSQWVGFTCGTLTC